MQAPGEAGEPLALHCGSLDSEKAFSDGSGDDDEGSIFNASSDSSRSLSPSNSSIAGKDEGIEASIAKK